jgi:hypothetical protein
MASWSASGPKPRRTPQIARRVELNLAIKQVEAELRTHVELLSRTPYRMKKMAATDPLAPIRRLERRQHRRTAQVEPVP